MMLGLRLFYVAAMLTIFSFVDAGPALAEMIHRWTFNDGTARDSAGTADGTLQGDASVSGGEVHLSGGSGATSRVVLPAASIAINTYSEVTFEAWWTMDFITYWAKVFSFGNSVPGFGPTLGHQFIGHRYVFANSSIDVSGNIGVAISDGADGDPYTEEVRAFPNPSVSAGFGVERHLAVTMDDSSMTLYVDGVLQATTSLASQPSMPTIAELSNSVAYLGGSPYSVDGNLHGSINEFRIYNTVLDSSQVATSFQTGPTPVPEPASLFLLTVGMVAGLGNRIEKNRKRTRRKRRDKPAWSWE